MKITCQACSAKYTIADEKVVGKTVKIRCKKCGANIVVNAADGGGDASRAATGPATADTPQRLGGGAASEDGWMLNVAEGDQRTMTLAEIVAEYGKGVVTDETFCWKDGMGDWLPLREIPELQAACAAGGAPSERGDDDATRALQRPPAVGNGAGAAAAAAPAARRAVARAPSADLFGNAAQAGGEDDVLTSAPVGAPERHDDAKPIGARNENSVLFSLGALTGPAAVGGAPAPENKTTATSEASGLIDIRQLSAQLGSQDDKKKKQSRVDDIMNLGGGAFTPGLSAPVLSAPAVEEFAAAPSAAAGGGPAPSKNRGVVFAAIGGGVLLIAGVIGLTFSMMNKTDDKAQAAASASGAQGAPSASATVAAAQASTSEVAAAQPSAAAPVPSSAPAPTPTDTSTATTAKTATAPTDTHTSAQANNTPPPEKTAPGPAAPPANEGGGAVFDMAEAKTRLAAIAGAVQSCKKGDLSGSGKVIVTFATSGAAQSAVVSGAPFEGTPTGACVAGKFRGARVPAFSGVPFTVSKSFNIN